MADEDIKELLPEESVLFDDEATEELLGEAEESKVVSAEIASDAQPVSQVEQESIAQESSLQRKLAEAEALAVEYKDKYLRSLAELENYRKRALRERADILRYAGEGLARDILEVVDTLEIAVNQIAGQVESQGETLADGVRLIFEKFSKILEAHSITAKSNKGEAFDPSYQEALASVPTSEYAPGTVIDILRKAYFFKDKLLRPGQVVVATEIVTPN